MASFQPVRFEVTLVSCEKLMGRSKPQAGKTARKAAADGVLMAKDWEHFSWRRLDGILHALICCKTLVVNTRR